MDYVTLAQNPMELVVVATEAETGKAHYFDKRDIFQDDYSIMKASSAIPFVCHPYEVRGVPYFDGALADPIPIEKAFELGCDKVVLLLTLPVDTVRTPDKDRRLAKGIRKRYPLSAVGLERRAQRYNESVALARRYAMQGKVLIIAPDDTCGVSTLKRNADNMRKLYDKGYGDGQKLFLSSVRYKGEHLGSSEKLSQCPCQFKNKSTGFSSKPVDFCRWPNVAQMLFIF